MQRETIRRFVEKARAALDAIEEELNREPNERAGGPPQFGWHKNPDRENPKEQKIIARIVELRAAGNTFEEIVAVLNREGHKTRQGGKWHIPGVQRIFVNQEKRAKA